MIQTEQRHIVDTVVSACSLQKENQSKQKEKKNCFLAKTPCLLQSASQV